MKPGNGKRETETLGMLISVREASRGFTLSTCFPFPVSRFPFPVSRFPFPVSRLFGFRHHDGHVIRSAIIQCRINQRMDGGFGGS